MPAPVDERARPVLRLAVLFVAAYLIPAPALQAQDTRCSPVTEFLGGEMGMETRVDADTLRDWRTGLTLSACRVTAAGVRSRTLATAARNLYERLRAAGWTRTPNPADAPNESSLRFRLADTDCLFNVYTGILLATPAEFEVSSAIERGVGERIYNVLVQCVPALPARTPG